MLFIAVNARKLVTEEINFFLIFDIGLRNHAQGEKKNLEKQAIVISWAEQSLVDNLHQGLSVSLTNRLAVGAKAVGESHLHRAADKEKCLFIFFFVTFNSCIMSLAILENHISYP